MTPSCALHTAARCYCETRIAYWHDRYARLQTPRGQHGYSDEQRDVYPRYNVLEAILVEVERLRPEALQDLQNARSQLRAIGRSAESLFTERPGGPIEQSAMRTSASAFARSWNDLGPGTFGRSGPCLTAAR